MKATTFVFLVKLFGWMLPRRLLASIVRERLEYEAECMLNQVDSASNWLSLSADFTIVFAVDCKRINDSVAIITIGITALKAALPRCSKEFRDYATDRLSIAVRRLELATN